MKTKSQRLAAIKHMISTEDIFSQEQLVDRLFDQGIEVTQATLSRDLKLLQVSKVPDGRGGNIYALTSEEDLKATEDQFILDFLRGYISVDGSGNLLVLKTLPGHAPSVAAALDNLEVEGALGTVAGDDTVLIILKEGILRGHFYTNLKHRIPGWDSEEEKS
ncbi:MAG: hypothetical protein A2Z96_05100 [Spirochaetes bacterium GWB1_48_6]|nr:MAG: hypothetical protein A2Z96_05100 [Spirochaetes bacterium GWB1_48_6]